MVRARFDGLGSGGLDGMRLCPTHDRVDRELADRSGPANGRTLDDGSTRTPSGPVGWYIITSQAEENLSA